MAKFHQKFGEVVLTLEHSAIPLVGGTPLFVPDIMGNAPGVGGQKVRSKGRDLL